MTGESISLEAMAEVLNQVKDMINCGRINECNTLIKSILSRTKDNNGYINKGYIDDLVEKKRRSRIDNIERMGIMMFRIRGTSKKADTPYVLDRPW